MLSDDEKTQQQKELMYAIASHDTGEVGHLIHNKGMSPNFTRFGVNPVCKAAMYGFSDILDILVEGGCDITMPNMGKQALHIATLKGHVDFVQRLLAYGADINSRDNHQKTALSLSVMRGNSEMVDILINSGAAINIAMDDGSTLLHEAACSSKPKRVCIIKLLLANGAEINRTDSNGWSALHWAICFNNIEILKTLLDWGASLTQKTHIGESMMHIVARKGHRHEVAKLLYSKGVEINERDINGHTPFYQAIFCKEYKMAEYLSQIGANMYIPDFMKWTPFYSAAILGLERFILLFIEAGYNLSHESWLLKGDYPVELSKNREFCLYLRQYARKPKTLRDECRLRIRSPLGFGDKCNKNVSTLDLPVALKDFITYRSLK